MLLENYIEVFFYTFTISIGLIFSVLIIFFTLICGGDYILFIFDIKYLLKYWQLFVYKLNGLLLYSVIILSILSFLYKWRFHVIYGASSVDMQPLYDLNNERIDRLFSLLNFFKTLRKSLGNFVFLYQSSIKVFSLISGKCIIRISLGTLHPTINFKIVNGFNFAR